MYMYIYLYIYICGCTLSLLSAMPLPYKLQHDASRERCNLSFCNSMDTMDHLLGCPALVKEHLHLKQHLDASSSSGGSPMLPLLRSPGSRTPQAVAFRCPRTFHSCNHLSPNFWKTYWNY